ncbi:MAG: cytochrome C [Betaproteobacteria bacterium RIFCSPLOWO2_02_FULL_67_26]|nr:MAG: cytochrome C [Betaproteobacteria bacterium RIFCSPLOWO2_02_FULL_67_26]
MRRFDHGCALLVACLFAVPALGAGDTERGAKAFQACVACHSLEPGRHFTGPSLASLFGRKAGTAPGFQRYSDALKVSGVEWNEKTLDAWIRDPAGLIPGNVMTFPGLKDEKVRRDLISYLKVADSKPGLRRGGPRLPDLKKAPPEAIVKTVRHCGDTYFVTTGDDRTHKIWEFNLRLKTDTSVTGPLPGKPVIVGAGMQGDRAAVVFAGIRELGEMVKERCE